MSRCVGREWEETLKVKSDSELLRILESHAKPEFWEGRSWYGMPSKAYVRNWSSRCRREGRRRGLL